MKESALSVIFYRVCNLTHGVVFHPPCNFTQCVIWLAIQHAYHNFYTIHDLSSWMVVYAVLSRGNFFLQIYALSSVKFPHLKLWLCKKWQIWGIARIGSGELLPDVTSSQKLFFNVNISTPAAALVVDAKNERKVGRSFSPAPASIQIKYPLGICNLNKEFCSSCSHTCSASHNLQFNGEQAAVCLQQADLIQNFSWKCTLEF